LPPKIKPNHATGSGFSGAPMGVRFPSLRKRWIDALKPWSAEAASGMKAKLRACFCLSSAWREITTTSAPRRSASSFLAGEVVNTTTRAPIAQARRWPPPSGTEWKPAQKADAQRGV
jgi:hypothetical protein